MTSTKPLAVSAGLPSIYTHTDACAARNVAVLGIKNSLPQAASELQMQCALSLSWYVARGCSVQVLYLRVASQASGAEMGKQREDKMEGTNGRVAF